MEQGRVARRTPLPRTIWIVLAAGVVVHVIVALVHEGVRYDIESYRTVARALPLHRFDVYSVLSDPPGHRWPYPPGFFPWLAIAGQAFAVGSFSFAMAVKAAVIACDIVIAAIV